MEIISLGDSALVLRVSENSESNPEGVLRAILDLQARLQHAALPWVVECAPAYASLGVFLDFARAIEEGAPEENLFDWIEEQIRAVLARPFREKANWAETKIVEIPVCYETEFGLDLEEVAKHTGLSPAEVVRRHSAADYRVHCVGFMAGFPFLGGLPTELSTPRRATPRKQVPAGSVAIGGVQTGVYPMALPGGWNVIGRTALRLFDPQRAPPALLAAGSRVRFRAITRAQFDASLA